MHAARLGPRSPGDVAVVHLPGVDSVAVCQAPLAGQAKGVTVRSREREWNTWLGRLTADQIEHVLLSLTEEREAWNGKLRRLRAELRQAETERERVKLRTRKAQRRLARLNKAAA